MKKLLLAVVFSCLPIFGQGVFSGSGVYSGAAQFLGNSGGAPLTYPARTDNCVTGSESGCVTGATTGQAGSALSFLLRNTDSVPFTERASAGTGASDPDFGAYEVLATDQTTSNTGTPYAASWNLGSDGGHDSFSADEKLLFVFNSGGGASILYINPTLIHAHGCSPSSVCVAESGIYTGATPDSTHLAAGGSFSFSRASSETNILYELANPPTQINRITICRFSTDPGCTGQAANTLIRIPYIDFTSDTYGACSVLAPIYNDAHSLSAAYSTNWTGSFQVANDGSASYGMGGGYDWLGAWTPTLLESFIMPILNNSGSKGFQATAVAGATGGAEPNWDSSCSTLGSTCTDGAVTWTNVGGMNGQGPGFDVLVYRPGRGCSHMNTRIGKMYRGTGSIDPAGYMTTADAISCTRYANGGTVPSSCPFSDRFTLHEVEQQQNGRYLMFSPTGGEAAVSSTNWNAGTASCQNTADAWIGAWSNSTTYASKNVVSHGGLYYTATSASGNVGQTPPSGIGSSSTYWAQTEYLCNNYFLDTQTINVTPCDDYAQCTGHGASGYVNRYYGKKYVAIQFSNPVISGNANPGTAMLTASLPGDNHGSYRDPGLQDLSPILAFGTDVPGSVLRYTAACYSEICAVKPDGSGTEYRLGHNFNDGSAANFSIENAIGVISPLGDLVAFGTDMMGTRGANTVANTTCNKLRGTYPPAAGLSLNLGDTVYPVTGNSGFYIYQTTTAGTSTTATPAGGWDQTVGDFVPYGTAVLQNIGASNCRGDVVVLDALSAHQ
jgi:hypothetical protein